MEFEWDENKNIANQLKHGISFEQTITIFTTSSFIDYERQIRKNETRYKIVGHLKNGKVIAVIVTRRSNRIRIISSRTADRVERSFYHEYKKNIA